VCENAFLQKLLRIVFSGRALSMNSSSPGFLSYQFETEILLSENAFVFLHDQDPLRKSGVSGPLLGFVGDQFGEFGELPPRSDTTTFAIPAHHKEKPAGQAHRAGSIFSGGSGSHAGRFERSVSCLRSFRRSAKERLVCAQRRYLSAILFHAALFSLLRRKLAISPHSMACLRSSSD
jgi:hypothetical protein